jgi:hypothetical protein
MQTQTNTASKMDDGVEITPKMAEAGADVAWRSPLMEPDEAGVRQMVADIFRAMLQASPTRHP